VHQIILSFVLQMRSLMRLSFLSVLTIKAGNKKGLRALLRLSLSFKMTIPMVPSLTTMMHLITLNVGTLVNTNLYISGRAMQTIVLCHPLPLEVVALALHNRFRILCTHNGKLLQSNPCARVLGCKDQSSGQAMSMVNHSHLAESFEMENLRI
jgi:hypothetical protein